MPDVIVIGVGPAGANAARFAAREGLDVLAVDQRQEIGAPKRCAEGVVLEVLKRDMVPEDERWIAQRIHGLTFVAPNGRRVSAREDHVVGVVVERKLFDKYLATLAVRDGANVQAWTRAESVVRDGDTTRVTLSSAGRTWAEEAAIVICCGGGGVPVMRDQSGHIRGMEAVIDKDRVAALLAVRLQAPRLVITTGVDTVYTHFGTPRQKALRETDVEEIRALARQGHFPAGSMRPKMEASIYYLNRIDGEAIICSPDNLAEALAYESGTRILRTIAQD